MTWSKGFKSGGFDNRATRLDLATRPFAPETVDAYETGLKTELIDHRARLNLVVFYNDYKDLQVAYTDPAYPAARSAPMRARPIPTAWSWKPTFAPPSG